jgi:hypothetical protein
VAGDSLTVIEGDEGLGKELLDFSEEMDVVIACRVSPK